METQLRVRQEGHVFNKFSRQIVLPLDYDNQLTDTSGVKIYAFKRKFDVNMLLKKGNDMSNGYPIIDNDCVTYLLNALIFDMLNAVLVNRDGYDPVALKVVIQESSNFLKNAELFGVKSRLFDFIVGQNLGATENVSDLLPFLPAAIRQFLTGNDKGVFDTEPNWPIIDLKDLKSLFKKRVSPYLEPNENSASLRFDLFVKFATASPYLTKRGGFIDEDLAKNCTNPSILSDYRDACNQCLATRPNGAAGIDNLLVPLADEVIRRSKSGWAKTAVVMCVEGPCLMALPDKSEIAVKEFDVDIRTPLSTRFFQSRFFPCMVYAKWNMREAMEWAATHLKDASLAIMLINRLMVYKDKPCVQYAKYSLGIITLEQAMKALAAAVMSPRGITGPWFVVEGHPGCIDAGHFIMLLLATFDELRSAEKMPSLKIKDTFVKRFKTNNFVGANRAGLEQGSMIHVLPGKGGRVVENEDGTEVLRNMTGYNKHLYAAMAQLFLGEDNACGNGAYAIDLDRAPMTPKQNFMLDISLKRANKNDGIDNAYYRFSKTAFCEEEDVRRLWNGDVEEVSQEELGQLLLSFVSRWAVLLTKLKNEHSTGHFDLGDGKLASQHCGEYMYYIHHRSGAWFPCRCVSPLCPTNLSMLSLFLMSAQLARLFNKNPVAKAVLDVCAPGMHGRSTEWTVYDFNCLSPWVCAHLRNIYYDLSEHNEGSVRHLMMVPNNSIRWHYDVPFFTKKPCTELTRDERTRGRMLAHGEWKFKPYSGCSTTWETVVNLSSFRLRLEPEALFKFPTVTICVGHPFTPSESHIATYLAHRTSQGLGHYLMGNLSLRQMVLKLGYEDIMSVCAEEEESRNTATYPDEHPFISWPSFERAIDE